MFVQTEMIAPVQVYPRSIVHPVHPSLIIELPSSHASPVSMIPLPQVADLIVWMQRTIASNTIATLSFERLHNPLVFVNATQNIMAMNK